MPRSKKAADQPSDRSADHDANEETFAIPVVDPPAAEGLEPLPPNRYLDREISWLAFNERVLQLAEDPATPLLERAFFLAIVASNLDEFFMVRIAGLKRRIITGLAVPSETGMSPTRLLDVLIERTHALMDRHAGVFTGQVLPKLADVGIRLVRWADLDHEEHERLRRLFRKEIFPVLTPLAVDPGHPFPYISGLSLNLAVNLRDPDTKKERFARVKVPETLPRFLSVSVKTAKPKPDRGMVILDTGPVSFVPVEDVIAAQLEYLFPGMEIVEHYTFRVTRNEDLELDDDDTDNLLMAMEQELLRRPFGQAVRLEIAEDLPSSIRDLLVRELGVAEGDVFRLPAPLDLTGLHLIAELDRPSLRYPPFRPSTHHLLAPMGASEPANVFAAMTRGDILLHHPYDSFSTSVQAFISQAARDPKVLAIKQTLYRTSGDSAIVDSLIEAARSGKQVLAIVEIKARFDESQNISWARQLEQAGVHVVYGLVGLKTHCKLSLVVRNEENGLHRYCHIGTGNYHPKTARTYEDYGLLTCDQDVAADLTKLFNRLSGYAPRAKYRRLLVAPTDIRTGIIARIDEQTERARGGKEAWVKIKVNAIVDEKTIDALYRASEAGVTVDMMVRGQCSLMPGVPGLSDTIRVKSVLGRFLEHSRIYAFAGDDGPEVWIGSADLMHRNLDRRVEALVRIVEDDQKAALIENIDLVMDERCLAWTLGSDGMWTRTPTSKSKARDLHMTYIKRQTKRQAATS